MTHVTLSVLALIALVNCGNVNVDVTNLKLRAKVSSFDDPQKSPPLIPIAVLFGDPKYSQVKLSPNGRWLSYMAPYNGVKNVWVVPLADILPQIQRGQELENVNGRVLTNSTARPVYNYQWLRDDSIVFYEDTGGDENYGLTRVDAPTGARSILVKQDGVQAAVVKHSHLRPNNIIIKMNDRHPAYFDYYNIDIATGTRTPVIINTMKFQNIIFDDLLTPRLAYQAAGEADQATILQSNSMFQSGSPDDVLYYYLSAGNVGDDIKDWSLVNRIASRDEGEGPVGINVQDNKVYWVNALGTDKTALRELNLPLPPNPTGIGRLLFNGAKADITKVFMDPKTHIPLAIATRYDTNEWVSLSRAFDRHLKTIVEWVQQNVDGGDVNSMESDLDMNYILLSIEDMHIPTRYLIYDTRRRTVYPALRSNPTLERYQLPRTYGQVIQTRDDYHQLCYVTLPSEVDYMNTAIPIRPVPMVVFPHQGPWWRDRREPDPWVIMMANRGYAVMQCQFRSSTGFGKRWTELGNGEWAGKIHADILDGVEWAVQNSVTSRDIVAIAGISFGGYSTLVGLTFTPKTFACGIDISGPANLVTLVKTIPPYWKPLIAQLQRRIGANFTSPQGVALMQSRSPVNKVEQIEKPLLIVQGVNDARVKQDEAEQIVNAMLSNDLPVTYLLFPDEGHIPERPDNKIAIASISDLFLKKCLNGRSENLSVPEGSSIMVEQVGNMNEIKGFSQRSLS